MVTEETLEIVWLPVDEIQPDPLNPNVEDAATFNSLVDAIREVGFIDPVHVRPTESGYVCAAGEHRWRAAKVLGMERVPTIIHKDWDEDIAQINMVRMNAVKGRANPAKFTRLFLELQKRHDKYGPEGKELLRQKLGVGTAEFKRVYREAAAALRIKPSKRDENRIESLSDLALVLNSLYARYGSTLPRHFMFFQYNGKTHLMVLMDDDLFASLSRWVTAQGEEADINSAFATLFDKETP